MSPYVVTLAIDDEAQARFDELRATHFPAGRTAVGAHVTLFHAVPGELDVTADLAEAADRDAFTVQVTGLKPLGRGVAYALASDDLTDLHGRLQRRWHEHLTKQDRQGFRPHVTVQNKVTPEVARETLASLAAGFTTYAIDAVGRDLWRYAGGPWTHVERFSFTP